MALFQIVDTRWLDTDHVADIEYTPSHDGVEINLGDGPFSIPESSRLEITLKNGDHIALTAEAADEAWAAFQAVLAQSASVNAQAQSTSVPVFRET